MSLATVSAKFTEETLDEIIKSAGGVKHTSWKFAGGFKKGDSYLSEVFRITVNGVNAKDEIVSVDLVVKSLPKNIGRRKTFRSTDFFRNECNFYNKIMKTFDEFQKRNGAKNPFNDVPKCFSAFHDGENDYIAMEDLSKYGYVATSRQTGLDFEHCRLAMEIIGRFHAVSLAMKDKEPEEFQKLINTTEEPYFDDKHKSWYASFAKSQIIVTRDAIKKEYPGTVIEEKVIHFTDEHYYDRMSQITRAWGPYSVIGHGDVWAPNFLTNYEDINGQKIPKHIKIIDFQLARYGSPVIDISFFIYSCTTQDLREKHYDELIKIYYESCSDLIKDLGSDPDKVFPFSALQDELKKFARFGCGMGMEAVPFSIMEDADTFDLDSIQGDEAIPLGDILIIKPIPTKEGRLRVADMFKHAVQSGYFD